MGNFVVALKLLLLVGNLFQYFVLKNRTAIKVLF